MRSQVYQVKEILNHEYCTDDVHLVPHGPLFALSKKIVGHQNQVDETNDVALYDYAS